MSYQTTMARAAANHWEREWEDHKRHCPECSGQVAKRAWDDLCPAGHEIRGHMLHARLRLDRERELDRQPIDGEAPLF